MNSASTRTKPTVDRFQLATDSDQQLTIVDGRKCFCTSRQHLQNSVSPYELGTFQSQQ